MRRRLAGLSTATRFFFNDTATTEIYTLSLHDALPISHRRHTAERTRGNAAQPARHPDHDSGVAVPAAHLARPREPEGRSEEHTSELQSQSNLVCRLLLEKKNWLASPCVCGSQLAKRHN